MFTVIGDDRFARVVFSCGLDVMMEWLEARWHRWNTSRHRRLLPAAYSRKCVNNGTLINSTARNLSVNNSSRRKTFNQNVSITISVTIADRSSLFTHKMSQWS